MNSAIAPPGRKVAETHGRGRRLLIPAALCLAAAIMVLPALASAADPVRHPQVPAVFLAPADPGYWRVEYRFDEPVTELSFQRVSSDWRSVAWKVLDPDFRIESVDEQDRLSRTDQAAFHEVVLEVPARYRTLPKEYAPFAPFRDGGLLVHSGQFHACSGSRGCPDALQWTITVTPRPGEHVVAGSRLSTEAVQFESRGGGINFYIGPARPQASAGFVAVIDESLPEEVRALMDGLFPELLQALRQHLGELDQRPALFASLDPDPPSGSGYNHQGGVLPGQVFIHLYGEQWAEGAAVQLKGLLPWFFAHEAAHLFQRAGDREVFDNTHAWIHEGGAEAMAALLLAELEAVPAEYLEQRKVLAVQHCADGLGELEGQGLETATAAGRFDIHYTCGLVVGLALDGELKAKAGLEDGLFALWRLYLQRLAGGASAGPEAFLEAAADLGAARLLDPIRRLVARPPTDPAELLNELLSAQP